MMVLLRAYLGRKRPRKNVAHRELDEACKRLRVESGDVGGYPHAVLQQYETKERREGRGNPARRRVENLCQQPAITKRVGRC